MLAYIDSQVPMYRLLPYVHHPHSMHSYNNKNHKEYLPVYLSYFFVSLSISGSSQEGLAYGVLLVFVLIIWVFTSLTTTYYFNPLLLLMGYKFYNVTSNNGIELFILSRRIIRKNEKNIIFPKLKKLTETVYLDII